MIVVFNFAYQLFVVVMRGKGTGLVPLFLPFTRSSTLFLPSSPFPVWKASFTHSNVALAGEIDQQFRRSGVCPLMWSEKVYRMLVQAKRVETWQHLPLTTLDEEADLGA